MGTHSEKVSFYLIYIQGFYNSQWVKSILEIKIVTKGFTEESKKHSHFILSHILSNKTFHAIDNNPTLLLYRDLAD